MEEEMNLVKKIIIASFSTFMLTGCFETPVDIVNDIFNSAKDGDMITIIKISSESVAGEFALSALKTCSVDKKSYKDNLKLINT